MKIAPEEVESLLADHPKIADVAVVGIADERMEGEQVVTAVVVPKEGETIEFAEVRDHLRGRGVAGYKEPRKLVVVEALPRNALGKVLKREYPRNRQLGSASRFRGAGRTRSYAGRTLRSQVDARRSSSSIATPETRTSRNVMTAGPKRAAHPHGVERPTIPDPPPQDGVTSK